MTHDEKIAKHAFHAALSLLDRLLNQKEGPIPNGLYQKYLYFFSFVNDNGELKKIDFYGLYDKESSPWWLGYASCIESMINEVNRRGFEPFVEKKKSSVI